MNAKNIRIQILVDNNAKDGLRAEHGFSLWIEIDDQKILFDTGQKDSLLYNAKQLNIDLAKANTLVLSHGHYDHSGGLANVLSQNHQTGVYSHAAAVLPRYSINDGIAKSIKMPSRVMSSINSLPEERMHWVTDSMYISDAVALTGEIPRNTDFEDTGGLFYLDQDGKKSDPIKDDMALWIHSSKGLVVCVGCCHAGIINTINHIKKVSGVSKIHALIGGLHLLNANQQRLNKTMELLQKEEIQTIITCHCTGDIAHQLLGEQLQAQKGYSGMSIEFTS